MKLYTKAGDDGKTGLYGGARVPKCDVRVQAYGEVDALCAYVGVVVACCDDANLKHLLCQVQSDLFTIGGELATPDDKASPVNIDPNRVSWVEQRIDEASAQVEPLKQFVLPGGSETAAHLHIARVNCRRAERAVVCLAQTQSVRDVILHYLNRLSDLLFALARADNYRQGIHDIPWEPAKSES